MRTYTLQVSYYNKGMLNFRTLEKIQSETKELAIIITRSKWYRGQPIVEVLDEEAPSSLRS